MMDSTIHKRAFSKAITPHMPKPGEPIAQSLVDNVEAVCQAYLQTLLDDAETVEACSKAYLNAAIEKDQDFEIMGRVHCAMKEALATLKRMGNLPKTQPTTAKDV